MAKYLVQISPDPFDFVVADDSNIDQASRGAHHVGKQDEHEPQGEEQGPAAMSSKDGSHGYGLCYYCGGGSYTHYCDDCRRYID